MNKVFIGTLLLISFVLGIYIGLHLTAVNKPNLTAKVPNPPAKAFTLPIPVENSVDKASLSYVLKGTVETAEVKAVKKTLSLKLSNGKIIGPYELPDDVIPVIVSPQGWKNGLLEALKKGTNVRAIIQFDVGANDIQRSFISHIELK